MKFNHKWWNSWIRWGLAFLWAFVAVVLLWMFAASFAVSGDFPYVKFAIFLAVGVAWLYLVQKGIREASEITLTEEGIRMKTFFKARLIPWQEIRQAGVLWLSARSGHYNDLVLLRKDGSPRKYQDKTFLLRNEFCLGFRLIHLPCTPESLAFVRKCYGPLDFNLADGRGEQHSIVEDVDIFRE